MIYLTNTQKKDNIPQVIILEALYLGQYIGLMYSVNSGLHFTQHKFLLMT